ncbi:hypothetical protein EJB05_26629, partial [Eragrostis curvula]
MERVDAKQTVRMNPGEGEMSYARNSKFQSAEQSRMKPLIEGAIKELCCTTTPLANGIVIADLGCSCGPNAITLVSTAVDAIHRQYGQLQLPLPELSLHLNDLPSNDFNTVVKHLVAFQHRLNGENSEEVLSPLVSASIVPGSFYGRLFTTGSVHLFLSSNSLHWLSQAPEDLVKNGIPMYHNDQQVWQKMHPVVRDAYARQFRKDFMLFLRSRAKEMVPGGRMVLSFTATCSTSQTQTWEFIALILDDMASRDVLDKEKLKTFYIPLYAPYETEVKEIVEEQGSFSISNLQMHDSIDADKALINPKMIAYGLNAAFAPIIRDHFGSSKDIMDAFVRTAEQLMTLANLHDELANNPRVFIAVTLARKA